MPTPSKVKEFPDLSSKLTAPVRKSVFERHRAEAEAKRQREEAENAAALDDFVKSFEGDDADEGGGDGSERFGHGAGGAGYRGGMGFRGRGGGGSVTGRGAFGGMSKRQFGAGAQGGPGIPTGPSGGIGKSGPGTLGSTPPSSLRKRAFDGSIPGRRDTKDVGLFAFENSGDGLGEGGGIGAKGAPATMKAFQNSDDENETTSEDRAAEKAAPKPTLHLSALPLGTSPALVKSLIPSKVTVDNVRMMAPPATGSTERRSLSAIVTLAKDTPGSDIDNAVSALQNRYLGWGFHLSISRHLSSAALGVMGSGGGAVNLLSSSLPFGAKTLPMPERKGFAPPPSYGGVGAGQYGMQRAPTRVLVNPPPDIRQVKLIHKTIENLITHGPEFEALLMSRPEVQKGERWSWLWDARSAGGVWYRWKLWEIMTDTKLGPRGGHFTLNSVKFPFTDGPGWFPPEKPLLFEYATNFSEFVSDSEYDSSEEEDVEDEGQGRPQEKNMSLSEALGESTGKLYMNPLQKAKLVHLLSRLPRTTGRLRKGDVARITAFAIKHAGEGADEVVDMIISNVENPFSWMDVKGDNSKGDQNYEQADQDDDTNKEAEKEDQSSSKLIALFLVSDILSSSSTSGVRHAWKYRQLFETALKQKKTFEGLGRLEKVYDWGRLRAEKWKRSVNSILSLWESWCVFPQAAQEYFVDAFMNPPLTEEEKKAAATKPSDEEAQAAPSTTTAAVAASKSKWKTVDEKNAGATNGNADESMDIDDDEDIDGEPMEDADLDGEPMEDVDGELMDDDGDGLIGEAMEEDKAQESDSQQLQKAVTEEKKMPVPERDADGIIKKPRPKAMDMFADSEED